MPWNDKACCPVNSLYHAITCVHCLFISAYYLWCSINYYNRVICIPRSADRVWDSFQETVKMSTYMVAFVISDLVPVVNSVESVNVWGRPEIAGKGELARMTALRALDYLYMETGHKYSLPKLDLVGLPDSYVGAMENWGLATFR